MKFLEQPRSLNNPLLKNLMRFLIVVIALALLSDILLHDYKIGLSPSQATQTIAGNEEEFCEPMLFDSLLEQVHTDTLNSMISLLLLAVILIRLNPTSKQRSIHLAFISAISTQIVLLVSFYFSAFILLWIILFVLWHLTALSMAIESLWRLSK